MTTEIDQYRTDNALPRTGLINGYDPSNPKHAQWVISRRVEKLMRENEGMSYDEAWRTANAADDLKPFVDTMRKGEVKVTPPPERGWTPESLKRGYDLAGLVRKRMADFGETYDAAFTAVKNSPDNAAIFAAMQQPEGLLVYQKNADTGGVFEASRTFLR